MLVEMMVGEKGSLFRLIPLALCQFESVMDHLKKGKESSLKARVDKRVRPPHSKPLGKKRVAWRFSPSCRERRVVQLFFWKIEKGFWNSELCSFSFGK